MNRLIYQKIGGGYEYRYISECGEEYIAFGYSRAEARRKLRARLGWSEQRFGTLIAVKF